MLLTASGSVVGFAFAGSPARLPAGVRIAGVNVGGLAPETARARLEQRSRALAAEPVLFTSRSGSWHVTPRQLGVRVDWRAAVEAARREGEGFGPFRGFRRLGVRVFGADIAPPTQVDEAALEYELDRFARAIDRPHRDAAIRLRGLRPAVVAGRAGVVLDRVAATTTVARALAGFSRASVPLPVRVDRPRVTAARLAPAVAQTRVALSAPVRLRLGKTAWKLPRWRVARLLSLPRGGSRSLRVAGPRAERFFAALQRVVNRPPQDADFAVGTRGVRVVPATTGRVLDVPATGRALLAAAVSRERRTAEVVIERRAPERTTREARAMGITGVVGSYETVYGGEPNRIHNVQLVARLLDKHLIAPGKTFSFNRATGERSAEKGFLDAPVIINGELQTGLGGGVCQVSTTVFNAAYEAGLPITARTNHALYIDHYPLARDATVNYPDIDLRFVNDTGHWLLLRTFVGASHLNVTLYGTPTHRRVVSKVAPLSETGAPPLTRIRDSTLPAGKTLVVDGGEPSRSTSVRRLVYSPRGKLLYDTTWYSSYRGEARVVRVGTKKPKPAPSERESERDKRAPRPATPQSSPQ